ncbi:hypothetical protein GCM10023222_09590 [Saccharopolyspora cebuensis]
MRATCGNGGVMQRKHMVFVVVVLVVLLVLAAASQALWVFFDWLG